MDSGTFTVAVANPQGPATNEADARVLYVGMPNTLVVTFKAGAAVTLGQDTRLTLDFDRFGPSETPLAKASVAGVVLVTHNGRTPLTLEAPATLPGRSLPLSPVATLAPGDAIEITLSGVIVTAVEGQGRNPNFKGRWSDDGGDYGFGLNIAVLPQPTADKDLPLVASWGVQNGVIAVSADQSSFGNIIDLYLTNIGPDALALGKASFRISAPTVADGSDPARFDALCTEDEMKAARAAPRGDLRSPWGVANGGKVDENLAWTLAPPSDAVAPTLEAKASVGLRISDLTTFLESRDDFKVAVSIDCAMPGYASKTLRLFATKVGAALTAVCDTDPSGAIYSGAQVTLHWQTLTSGNNVVLERLVTGQNDFTLATGLAPTGSKDVFPDQPTAYRVTADGTMHGQTSVSVGLLAVALGFDGTAEKTVQSPLPGSPLVLDYDVRMASGHTLTPGVIAAGPGAHHASGQVTVYPTKTTSYALTAQGFDPDANPAVGSKSATVTVDVPSFTVGGRLAFGTTDGIWSFDFETGAFTRYAGVPAGVVVSEIAYVSYTNDQIGALLWGYADHPGVGGRRDDGGIFGINIIESGRGSDPSRAHVLSICALPRPMLHPAGPDDAYLLDLALVLLSDGRVGVVGWANGPIREIDLPLSPVNMARVRAVLDGDAQGSRVELTLSMPLQTPQAAGIGFVRVDLAIHNGKLSLPTAADFQTYKARPATMAVGAEMANYPLDWIDAADGALYRAARPWHHFPTQRLCNAVLADGCSGLTCDDQGNVFWFETLPDDPGQPVLCCYSIATHARATILRFPPGKPAPKGGGLTWL